jgi:hypothetical protein
VFAYKIPLKYFVLPAIGGVTFTGTWYTGLSTLIIIIGLILGLLLFNLKGLRPAVRQDTSFVGAEISDFKGSAVTGVEFYNTIKELGLLRIIYKKAEKGLFDIYEQAKKCVFSIAGVFRYLHNGVLPTYLVWCLLGMLGLFLVLLK